MINQIQAKILNDNGEALETQAGTLSVEEKTRLSNLVTKDPAIEMAKNSKIKIKDKDGVEFSATAEQILFGIGKMLRLANGTNYQEYIKNNKITVDGHVVDNSQFSGR
jgi:ribosomal protein S4E